MEKGNCKYSSIIIKNLQCEYRKNPIGISKVKPRLSWILVSSEHNQRQSAYRILVASKKELLKKDIGDLWDSKMVYSEQTNNIVYQGKPLKSRQICWWKVMIWDRDGTPSKWSRTAFWTMGLLNKDEFKGKWISYDTHRFNEDKELILPPCPYFRKELVVPEDFSRAIVYITALGVFELYINGKKVSRDLLTPGWTCYEKRVYYLTYDVKKYVKSGKNAIGVILGDGWFSGYVGFGLLKNIGTGREYYGSTPAFLLQLEIEYGSGRQKIIVSDETWKATVGPIKYSDILMGEFYDARNEISGWSEIGFDDSKWYKVEITKNFVGIIESYPSEPVRVVKEINPVNITKLRDETLIVDMGQNFAGKVRLCVKGKRGTKLVIKTAEMLYRDGSLMRENLRKARSTDIYILAGKGKKEIWEPHFTFHGFRYVEIKGFPELPEILSIKGIVMSSDLRRTGSFKCSNRLVNKIYKNILWTQLSNFVDIPTDCPQRDERLGWCGDAQIYIKSATYNSNVVTFFEKWITALNDEQWKNGNYPNYAPDPFKIDTISSPGWRDAGIICPYTIYKVYGDTYIIKENYKKMKSFINFLENESRCDSLKAEKKHFGDWLHLGRKTPNDMIADFYFINDIDMMKEMALAIGEYEDAKRFSKLAQKVRKSFEKKYLNKKGFLKTETQTGYAMALYMNILPEKIRNSTARRLVALIEDAGWHLNTGFLGIKHLLPVLSKSGHNDVACRLITNTTFPSWGYEIVNGATTIWERWDSYTREKGFQNPEMNSFNHYAFGSVCEWLFGYLAGIDTDDAGFRKITIKPHPDRLFSFVKVRYESINGTIAVEWSLKKNVFDLKVNIPCNVSATIYVPKIDAKKIKMNEKLNRGKDIIFLKIEGNYAVYSIGSGQYKFKGEYPI
ncbi:MAG: glycoside hydrolase family 78 protein [candidate division WOR-3 bacterium]|nr:glycoside hydrolase family 78 protein [candidate division WOR-3 bacterium]